jgi:hypothetical protein
MLTTLLTVLHLALVLSGASDPSAALAKPRPAFIETEA